MVCTFIVYCFIPSYIYIYVFIIIQFLGLHLKYLKSFKFSYCQNIKNFYFIPIYMIFNIFFHFNRKIKKEIKVLEDELPRAQVLVFPMTGINPVEFEPQTLAVLRGRLVRYLMRSREVS